MPAPRPRRVLDTRTARLAAADLLSRRAWTRRELATRLRRRGAPPEIAAEVVEDMAARGYVDDADFARHWVESRIRRGYGAGRLRAELRARGVASPVIDRALAPLTSDRTLAAARAVAARRLPVLARGAPDRLAHRLADYLMRRGYDGAVVSRVVRDMAVPSGRTRDG